MMKGQKKITKVRLQIDNTNDFIILGLVSSEPDYRLSLILNQTLGLSLKNFEAVNITGEEGYNLQFSRFRGTDNLSERSYTLVCNRSGKNFLIRKLKNIDFLLHIHDPECIDNDIRLISDLKAIPEITAVFTIDPLTIKDRNLDFLAQ